jgi:lymphocyte antigen 6 complex protein
MANEINLLAVSFLVIITTGLALECYSCLQQDGNKDKCIKTSKQCEQYQDTCYTSIRWAIPPYWTPKGNRIYFITKDCDTVTNCAARQSALRESCVRDWYLDWACHECCSGDLCNYYATLGSSRLQISRTSLSAAILMTVVAAYRFLL